ncbi:MAG: type II toxin-antitoxin system prevent-host-death family antitoxin [Verrucomicrobiales bacterium]|nr:type II toxin-antitoxin system prevent-host-death family antitoxin [Verrucomicrobiales bacterium]
MKAKKPVTYKLSKRSEPSVLRDAVVAEWGRVVTVRDAKAHLSALLEWVAAGHELTITSDGEPKAKLIKAQARERGIVFQGMGDYLMKQPIHAGSADEAVNWTRGEW